MALTVKVLDEAVKPKEVDIARFETEPDKLVIEFAKTLGEEEIEVRSNIQVPIERALLLAAQFIKALQEHEAEYKTGYGLPPFEGKKE